MLGNEVWQLEIKQWVEADHPNITIHGYEITSPDTIDYNCVAWAMEDTETWWWPNPEAESYWPEGVSRKESVDCFIETFSLFGYEVCSDQELETGFQKIAIYAFEEKPTHVARQLDNGSWTSKLGSCEDITHHQLSGLEGEKYGYVAVTMKKQITG